jgi:predicted nucleotidyltransferase/DNA-binding XRE family transcriptional regulator
LTISYTADVGADRPSAAAVLRAARKRAGLSQVELADRAGITQSVISAYESGRRQPSLPTLAGLIEAAGYELEVTVQEPAGNLGRLTGPVGRRVRRRRAEIVAAAAAHGVANLRVFGSVARGEDHADSDVDLLIDVPAGMGLFGLGRVADDLEAVVGARVDLVPAGQLKPDVRRRAEHDLVAL